MMRFELGNTQTLRVSSGADSTSLRPVVGRGPRGLPGPGSAAWAGLSAVTLDEVRQAPDGSWIKSTTARTTRATFDTTEAGFWQSTIATSATDQAAVSVAADARIDGVVFQASKHGAPGDNVGDELAALNALITTAKAARAYGRVTIALDGTHQINGTLTGLDGVTLDFTQGKLVQTAAVTRSIVINDASQVRLIRPRIEGKGATDYTNTSAVYGAAAIQVTGTSHHVWVIDPEISGCAGPGVQLGNNTTSAVHHVYVLGGSITGLGSPTITAVTSNYSGGVVVADGVSDWWVRGVEISQYAQGIVTGDTTRPHVDDNDIHDIIGQHGVYLDAVTGPGSVQRNMMRNCGLLGMKIQIANAGAHDITDVIVAANQAWNCGDAGFLIANAIGLGGSNKRAYRLKMFGNVAYNCAGDGFRLQNVTGGSFYGNDAHYTRYGWYLQSCADLVIDTYTDQTTDAGIRLDDSPRITVRGKVKNPATANNASTEFGLMAFGACDGLDVDGLQVLDLLGNVKYGAYYLGTGVESSRWRNFRSTGHTDQAVRLPASAKVLEWVNMPIGSDVVNPPTQARRSDVNTLLARNMDPAFAGAASNLAALLVAGTLIGGRGIMEFGGSPANVVYALAVTGTSLTANQCYAGVYDEAGNLIAKTASLHGTTAGSDFGAAAGNKIAALTPIGGQTLLQVARAAVDIVVLFNGTGTMPQFRGFSGSGAGNAGIVALAAMRFFTAGTGYTDLPTTLPTKTALTGANSEPFFGVS